MKEPSPAPPPPHTPTHKHSHTNTHPHTHTHHNHLREQDGETRWPKPGIPPSLHIHAHAHTHTRTRTHTRTQTHKDLGEVRDETKWPRARTGLPAPAAEVNNWRERNRGPKLVLSCNPAFPAQDIIFFSITSSIVTRKPQT